MTIDFWHVKDFYAKDEDVTIDDLKLYHPSAPNYSEFTGETVISTNRTYLMIKLVHPRWSPKAVDFISKVKFYEKESADHCEYKKDPAIGKHPTYLKGVWRGDVDTQFEDWNLISYEIHAHDLSNPAKPVFKSRIEWVNTSSKEIERIKSGGSGRSGWTWPG